MEQLFDHINNLDAILWGKWTMFTLLGMGILFTLWTKFTQYKSLTHGVQVIRGIYDDPDDPGAINHFQALSAALSATVGLGNIGGVALAIGAGGPGALLWMWIVGFFGMALKTVEITLTMMYRNTEEADNPHGGAMWVVENVIGKKGGFWKPLARIVGFFFCITLIISAFTGGNMFQSWSVAGLTEGYFGVPKIATGIIMAIIVGMVIIGGIKRIGSVAGKLVPAMCLLYLLCAFAVLAMHLGDIPGLLKLVVQSGLPDWLGGSASNPAGAFVGGSLAWAFSQGMKRALFSNEAGQGSAPIAHAAAKTSEPAREGIVGGIGPFIDTICICTLTALVILSTGTWNRGALIEYEVSPTISPAYSFSESSFTPGGNVKSGTKVYMLLNGNLTTENNTPQPSDRITGTIAKNDSGDPIIEWNEYTAQTPPTSASLEIKTEGTGGGPDPVIATIATMPTSTRAMDDNKTPDDPSDDIPKWGLLTAPQSVTVPQDKEYLWDNLGNVFTVLNGEENTDTGYNLHKLKGKAARSDMDIVTISWETLTSKTQPTLQSGTGVYREYDGANLTGHAFDRQFPGLGKWLVTFAAWLFAISTMISWSYYGEQGMVYMLGNKSVIWYKLVYLIGCIWAAAWITDVSQMESLMDLGTGAMLWSNLPIVLILGFLAVNGLGKYDRKLKAGEFPKIGHPKMEDVISGRDVE